MKTTSLVFALLMAGSACLLITGRTGAQSDRPPATLPNGWQITPAGTEVKLMGDLPVRMALLPGGDKLAIVTAGFHHHGVTIVDLKNVRVLQSFTAGQLSAGLVIDSDGQLLVSSGLSTPAYIQSVLSREGDPPDSKEKINGDLLRFSFVDGKLSLEDPFVLSLGDTKPDRYISGLALGRDGSLFLAEMKSDTVYRVAPSSVQPQAVGRTGYAPTHLALSPDEKELAVSNWGDKSVSLFDAQDLHEKARVPVGIHPNDLLYTSDGRLFIANASSNSVSVIEGGAVQETVKTSLSSDDLIGSTPNALAVSPDNKTLFVANADNNDVAVIDISRRGQSKVAGFIPTGWFPSALAVSADGKQLLVGLGKGLVPPPNSPARVQPPTSAPDNMDREHPYDYVGDMLTGYLEVVNMPNRQQLEAYTRQVRANFPDPSQAVDKNQEQLVQAQVFPKIKHVLYVIRENRTYDQVFGDMGKGNGDPSLVMFGRDVTPNAHELAGNGVLLDNLYVSGEVSQNGHEWANAAYATEFTSKDWLQGYSGHKSFKKDWGADYDDESKEISEKLAESPGGYLWTSCARHGLSYRSYGEYVQFRSGPHTAPTFIGPGDLKNHYSDAWFRFSRKMDKAYGPYPKDPKAVPAWFLKQKTPTNNDVGLADVFIGDLRAAEKTGEWPSYMVMSLGDDHTSGLSPGAFTPKACVGFNDQALGKIVEAVSHSRFWAETAIFVIEDDAQDGPDHVDARRTVGLVISPYTKKHFVDHTMYTTVSMVRTIEMILGLPPMSQYDTLATPMYASFTNQPDITAYKNLPPRTDLSARNPLQGEGAQASLKLDFSAPDRADPDALNRILWAALKPNVPMPPAVRSAVP